MTSNPNATITHSQIRRRANDYDLQIRQGLEDGSVRQVVKRLGADLVSKAKKFALFQLISLNPGKTIGPSYEGISRTSGCISAALVFVPIHSRLEQTSR